MDAIREDVFITELIINKVRHLENIHIPLSETERKHLILTGKNGSGKTSILETLANRFNNQPNYMTAVSWNFNTKLKGFTQSSLEKELVLAFYDARHSSLFEKPDGLKSIELKERSKINEKPGEVFLQHIVNLKAEKSFARDDADNETVKSIDNWFGMFEDALRELFDDPSLKLVFDRKQFNFQIIQHKREPFDFNTLADGYSAIINIITDLIMRMEQRKTKSYDSQGIVLIDEIESHLHIDMQKKILPFLTRFFPRVQFIVSTHSPFVLNSIPNAIIYDLEKNLLVSDLSAYSYDAILESYFDNDKYSQYVKDKLTQYELLIIKENRTDAEEKSLLNLKKYLEETPRALAPELKARFLQIKLSQIGKQ